MNRGFQSYSNAEDAHFRDVSRLLPRWDEAGLQRLTYPHVPNNAQKVTAATA
jgi:hypothetical protein